MRDGLAALDQLDLNLSSGNLLVLNLILGFVMFGVALGITKDDFVWVAKRPRFLLVGLVGQLVLLPAVTVVLVALLSPWLTPGVAMGMILVACCPGGNVSNFMVHLARGNTALSVSLTALSTAGALLFTPLNFAMWGRVYTRWILPAGDNPFLRSLEVDPFEVGKTVLLLLGIPLVLGMLVARFAPTLTARIETPIRLASIVLFATIVAVAFGKNLGAFVAHIVVLFPIVLLHNSIALAVGWTWAASMGLERRERKTISVEVGIQNSGLALVLLLTPSIFPSELPLGGMAAIAAWWGIWHIVSGLAIASWWRRQPVGAVPVAA
ncbi:MAG: bile acid:sodium symporter family protein [Rubricoccaceae bacterium]